MERKIAIPYVRMSTAKQLKGSSLARQTKLVQEYALENDLHLDLETDYSDIGKSAYKEMHLAPEAGLRRFLEAVEKGRIKPGSALIIESLDRLSRQHVQKALSLMINILQNEIEIHTISVAEKYVYTKDSDEKDLLLSLILLSRANNESRQKAERIRQAWEHKRNEAEKTGKPLTAKLPAWLKLEGGKIVTVPERTVVVKRIFSMNSTGVGHERIAKILNQEKVPVFGKGQHWHKSTISKILKNRSVIGTYVAKKDEEGQRVVAKEIHNYFPAVIEESLFNKVNYLNTNSPGRKAYYSNVFSGLLYCSHCGEKMSLVNKGKAPKGNKYLVCGSARYGLGCKYLAVRYDWFEESILPYISGIRFDFIDNSEEEEFLATEKEGLEIEINKIEEQVKNIESQLEEIIINSGRIPSFLTSKINELEVNKAEKIKSLGAVKGKLNVDEISIEDAMAALKNIDSYDYEKRARINSSLKRVIKNISVEVFKEGRQTVASALVETHSFLKMDFLLSKRFSERDIIYIGPFSKMRHLRLPFEMGVFKEQGESFYAFRKDRISELLSKKK